MTAPRPLPVHRTDYPSAFINPENVITVRVRGHLSEDGYGIGGRLVSAIDENGNPYAIVGLSPGFVRACARCQRKVYVPNEIANGSPSTVPCPYLDCAGTISTAPAFGDEQFEDAPARWMGNSCHEHGDASCLQTEAIE